MGRSMDVRTKGRWIKMQQERNDPSALSRRKILGAAGLSVAALALAACGSAAAASGSGAPAGSSPAAPQTPAAPKEAWLYMSIAVVKKGGDDWPEFVPSSFTVPANSTVHVEIRDFDDGAADVPAGYEKVQGTADGTMTLISSVSGDLSDGKTQTLQAVDPKNVAHTFTIADTNLSVPIPGSSTVRFDFKTGAAGAHTFQCMAACGTGDKGWAGPMADAGFMQGKMTVQA